MEILYGKPAHEQDYRRAGDERHREKDTTIAHGFNMNVLSVMTHPNPERAQALGVEAVDLDTLLSESDIITLHVPLTFETEHMISFRELAKMKPTAILINTVWRKAVNEDVLIEALRDEKIAGAGLDVFEKEPLPPTVHYYVWIMWC